MYMMKAYKYSGAGNDFVVFDGREADMSQLRKASRIASICDRKSGFIAADGRIGADGVMILTESENCDFRMEYYNSDGSGGMMCGNGGRCIVAFADELGIRPASEDGVFVFEAADGLHTGEVLSREKTVRQLEAANQVADVKREENVRVERTLKTVRISMTDVRTIDPALDAFFLNTGTRHFVRLVDDVEEVDVENEGRRIRWEDCFAPEGVNVNFVDVRRKVRTFEKGVEAETLACGTGLTACAVVLHHIGLPPSYSDPASGRVRYCLHARRDELEVDFIPERGGCRSVYLSGPAEWVRHWSGDDENKVC